MRKFHAALGLSSMLALAGAISLVPTISNAQPVAEKTYVACNGFGYCWRVHQIYSYGEAAPITYYNSDWYETHRADAQIHWVPDPAGPGYYDRAGVWHPDAAGRVVAGGAVGAGLGAAIGCLVTLPIGCAPGAAVGAAVGGGTGVVAGAASTAR